MNEERFVAENIVNETPGPLERYARILEVMTAYPDGLDAAELGRILALPKSTINRLLNALEASELIAARGKRNSRFVIGSRLNKVLESDTAWIRIATERKLAELANELDETCFITRLANGKIESVAMKSPDASVGIYVAPGSLLPWHATASGKLLMAQSGAGPEHATLEAITDRTIKTKAALKKEFALVLANGYAMERGEHINGLASLAINVPIESDSEVYYGVGSTGPETRIVQEKETILAALNAAVPQLSAILSLRNRGKPD